MDQLKKLIDLKSIITLAMTAALIAMLYYQEEVNKEILTLFCTSYGAIITYFFTHKSKGEQK